MAKKFEGLALPMGCCRDLCSTVFRFWLLVLNLVDLAVGLTLVGYAIWYDPLVGKFTDRFVRNKPCASVFAKIDVDAKQKAFIIVA